MTNETSGAIGTIVLGKSSAMAAVRARIERIGSGNASVIVTGPSGSGKECVARALHLASARRDGPFVAVNCGAIPRELIESELFGHERGAFTGAAATRIGRFEQAQGGTLFLDEIGDMPVDMQVKLLRVIEERAIQRVGGSRIIPFDARVVSATHRDLGERIATQQFREDLYYRLAVVPIHLPALHERLEDLPALVDHFLPREAKITFMPEAFERLARHDFPGNVRELRNLVERAVILHPDELLGAEHIDGLLARVQRCGTRAVAPGPLPSAPDRPPLGRDIDLGEVIRTIEQDYIRDALERTGGVVAGAARMLGLRRTTLIEKMRRYALDRPAGRPLLEA